MPGLLRGVARTAVVAGTFTGVSNRVTRRQQNRWAKQDEQKYYDEQGRAAQQAPAAPAPAAPAASAGFTDHTVKQLKDLADLKSQGILTEEEFAAQKAKILGM